MYLLGHIKYFRHFLGLISSKISHEMPKQSLFRVSPGIYSIDEAERALVYSQ